MDDLYVVDLDTEVALYKGGSLMYAGHGNAQVYVNALAWTDHDVYVCHPADEMKTWELPHAFSQFQNSYPHLKWHKTDLLLKMNTKSLIPEISESESSPSLEDIFQELLGEAEITPSTYRTGALQAVIPKHLAAHKKRLVLWKQNNEFHFVVKQKGSVVLSGAGHYKNLVGLLGGYLQPEKV